MSIADIYIPGTKINEDCVLLSPDDANWMEFVATHPDASIFHHPAWIELIADFYHFHPFVIAVLGSKGEINAGLPMMDASTAFRRNRYISLPFSDYCNPLYRYPESIERLTDCIVSLYRQGICSNIELRWNFPSHEEIRRCSNFVRHTVPMTPDMDQMTKRFNRVHRQNIRAAEQKGVRIVQSNEKEDLYLFYQMQLETRRRHGVPVQPQRFFEMLADKIFKERLGFVLLAYRDSECLAGMVILGWNTLLLAKYAASKEDTLNLRPNNLLFWNAIQWGCANGYKLFDMGRSDIKNEGLRRYKRGWGAEETPLDYSILSTTPDRQRGSHIVKAMAQRMIQHCPLWVCQLAGELFYRHLG